MILIIILSLLYISYIIFERIYHHKIRKSFKHIIHVNGTRGKSTTVRLIDAGLRNCGYKVFGKTTGTIPMYINTENKQFPIKRLGPANIREQLKIMRKAYREKAEILVIECMAVTPEIQLLSQEKILQADINIITNVLHDHLMEMGNTLDDIASALSNTIPKNGYLIVGNNDYDHIYKKKLAENNTEIMTAPPYLDNDTLGTFSSNIALALEVARILKLDLELFFNGMKQYHRDPASFTIYKIGYTHFLNGFSINDPDSIKINYDIICEKYNPEEITILLNVRDDRPSRTIQHIEMLKYMKFKKIIVMGTNSSFVKKKLKNYNINIEKINKIKDLEKEEIIFAIGNFANDGKKVMDYFIKNGVEVNG